MKRTTRKVLGLAAGGVFISGAFLSRASANTYTWQTTGTGNSQDWNTGANWSGGVVPGSSDTAVFSGFTPPSHIVDVNSSLSVGAVVDNLSTTTMTLGGSGGLTLEGETVTVPQSTGTATIGDVVIAAGNPSGAALSTANVDIISIPLNLANASQNVVVGSAASGLNPAQTITLSGNITQNAGAGPLTLYGGGTNANYGSVIQLTGNNSLSGLVISNTSGTEGAQVLATPSGLPTSGIITVNEQGQLLLDGPNTYGTGTTLDLNGPGVGQGVSSGSSGALRTSGTGAFTWAGNMNFGTSTTGSAAPGFVVISATGSNTLTVTGQVTGTGNLQKQGGGNLIFTNTTNTWSGSTQIGNGAITVDAGSSLGQGSMQLAQTSTNTPVINLFNANQSITSLLSSVFAQTTGNNTEDINLCNDALTIHQATTATFGYGANTGLVAQIRDGATAGLSGTGTLIYDGVNSSSAVLSLVGNNPYSGGTTINSGILNVANGTPNSSNSPLGSGAVTVQGTGTLVSGDGVAPFAGGTVATTGGISGNLVVNSGGAIAPGGVGLIGTLDVLGSVTANSGSNFDFDLSGGTSATTDTLSIGGSLALQNGGTETVNIAGSKLAYGSYTLATFGSLANAGTAFTLGSTPNGTNRHYSLSTTGNDLILNITDSGSEWYWSVGGGDPSVDGGGTWAAGSTNFFTSNPVVTQAAYSNSSTNPVIIGNGGNGGTITLTGSVTVGGSLIFSQANTPYTVTGTNALTLAAGIVGSNSATVSAPVILEGSQTFAPAAGTTLTVSGGVSETSGAGAVLTKGDVGTLILTGTGSYTGGTIIDSGVLQASTSAIPASGGVTVDSTGTLALSNATNGTYSGQISGAGAVAVNSASGSTTVTLGNSSNSYSGATDIESGVLAVGSTGALGTGAGGINFTGGTLQFTSSLNFPLGSPAQTINLVSGNSTIDTDGNNVTLNQDVIGPGNLTVANSGTGGGTLTLTGLIPTTVLGTVGVSTGATLELNPVGGASYGFSAPAAPGGYAGNLVLAGSLDFRLQGGYITGGGSVFIDSTGIELESKGASVIGNTIVLNPSNSAGFNVLFDSNAGNSLTITSPITGTATGTGGDVEFDASSSGTNVLSGQSTYSGPTIIGGAGETQLIYAAGTTTPYNVLPSTTDVHLNPNATLDLDGVTQMVGSIDTTSPANIGSATLENVDPGSANSTLILDGNINTEFAGFITDNALIGVGASGSLTLELGSAYTGKLNLDSGTFNSYSGGTILNGGTLELGTQGDQLLGASVGGVTFGGGTLELTSNWVTSRSITVNPGNSTISESSSTPGQSVNLTPASITWAGGTLALTNTGASTLVQNGGTISVTPGSTLSVAAGSSLTVSGTTDPFTDQTHSSNHVAIVNNGTFIVNHVNSSIAGITGTGSLSVGADGSPNTLQLATNSGGSSVGSLSIGSNSALDITNNHLFITYGSGPDPIASIQSLLVSGYNHGTWTGKGINSSAAAANSGSYGLGYADSADPGNPAGLSSGTIEVKYTLLGDANLSGVVDGVDFGILAANFNKGVSRWDQGDFNYDNVVDGTDFGFLAANFNKGTNGADVGAPAIDDPAIVAFAEANGLMGVLQQASVPEPATVGLLAMGSMGLLARRRRRNVSR